MCLQTASKAAGGFPLQRLDKHHAAFRCKLIRACGSNCFNSAGIPPQLIIWSRDVGESPAMFPSPQAILYVKPSEKV